MQAGYPDGFVIASKPAVHFGVGAVGELPAVVRAAGADHVVVVTDAVLAATPVIATVMAVLADAGLPARLFSGVHPNPTTVDIAAGAEAVAESAAEAAAAASASASAAAVTAMLKASAPSAGLAPAAARIALVAVGGGSPMDAAKGIAIAGDFAVPALPIVAVPTTAGTGAETSAFGVVTDPAAQRTVYVGHASSMPAAAILDPALTAGLPPAATAATGMDALTHALESYLSARPNPWSDGIALQVIRMVAASLPRAYADGTDLAARSQMLLAAHMAGVAMANTGLGLCHGIGRSPCARRAASGTAPPGRCRLRRRAAGWPRPSGSPAARSRPTTGWAAPTGRTPARGSARPCRSRRSRPAAGPRSGPGRGSRRPASSWRGPRRPCAAPPDR